MDTKEKVTWPVFSLFVSKIPFLKGLLEVPAVCNQEESQLILSKEIVRSFIMVLSIDYYIQHIMSWKESDEKMLCLAYSK